MTRCQNAPQFFERFYELFLAKNGEIRAKFEGVDMDRQMRMLKASLQMTVLASQPGLDPGFYLGRVAERHGQASLDIPPPLYDLWLDALLQTVEEKDPKYYPSLHETWTEVMSFGIHYMRSRYEG